VANGSERQRVLFGVPVTVQVVVLLLSAVGLTLLLGFAVLSWLESTT